MIWTKACHQLAFRRYTRPFSRSWSADFLKYGQVLGKNQHSKSEKTFFVYLERLIDDTPWP